MAVFSHNNIYRVLAGPLLLAVFLLFGNFVIGQEVTLQGAAKPYVSVGESFQLTYTLNAQGTDFKGPRITGFDVISGPFTSTSTSIQSVNGRTSMTVKYSFSYILQANREGTFEIPPASVNVDRRTITSMRLPLRLQRMQQPSREEEASSNMETRPRDPFLPGVMMLC